MTELEELKKQKKEIEAKIRELQNNVVTYGRAKLDYCYFPTARDNEWFVAYLTNHVDYIDNERYFSLVRGHDKQKVIDGIDNVIEDLKGLKEKLEGEKDHEDRD